MTRRRRVRTAVASLLFVAAGCTHPDSRPTKFGGTWTLKLGTHTFAVLALTQEGDRVTGVMTMPEHFQVGQTGVRFSNISASAHSRSISGASVEANQLRLSTINPKDPKDTDALELTLTGNDEATLRFVDAPFDPWTVERLPRGSHAAVSIDWEPTRSYSQDEGLASSPDMQRVYESDQKPRQKSWASLSVEERREVDERDAERRQQTRKFLADGRLHTGEDFKRAAFVFQHGNTPEDFLLAHTLAMVAMADGDADALWIASATLDRYLHSIGKPQVYGTQFGPDASATQEPYNSDLISDALRHQLAVPSLAEQRKQRDEFSRQFKAAAPPR
jgi:hypothetical protein